MPRGRRRAHADAEAQAADRSDKNVVDRYVGYRLRLRRALVGLSQQDLAQRLGMSFQQVQKYETGGNRISASRLATLCRLLDCPIGYFFEGLDEFLEKGADPPVGRRGRRRAVVVVERHGQAARPDEEIWQRRETLEFVRAYFAIPSDVLRHRLRRMIETIAYDAAKDEAK